MGTPGGDEGKQKEQNKKQMDAVDKKEKRRTTIPTTWNDNFDNG